jgi:AcrR family transcriptional regulator
VALERLERLRCGVTVKLDEGEDAAVVVQLEACLPQSRRPIGRQLRAHLGGQQPAELDVLGREAVSHPVRTATRSYFHRTYCILYYKCPAKVRIRSVTRRYQQRRRAEAAVQMRRRILDAVYEQLRAAPAEPISIDRIARAAEVARSTVYVAFGSRVGLFDALGEDLLKRAGFERMLRQSRQPDARESLRAGIHELAAMYAAERDVIRALVSMAQLDAEVFSGAIRRLEERRAHGMAELAGRLADYDQLRRDLDPEAAADALWLLTSFDAFDLLHTGRRLSTRRVADTLIAMAERAVCRDA